jgi:hypothetical protein
MSSRTWVNRSIEVTGNTFFVLPSSGERGTSSAHCACSSARRSSGSSIVAPYTAHVSG